MKILKGKKSNQKCLRHVSERLQLVDTIARFSKEDITETIHGWEIITTKGRFNPNTLSKEELQTVQIWCEENV